MLIPRIGSAANLNIQLHGLVLGGVCCCDAQATPTFVEAGVPAEAKLLALLQAFIAGLPAGPKVPALRGAMPRVDSARRRRCADTDHPV